MIIMMPEGDGIEHEVELKPRLEDNLDSTPKNRAKLLAQSI